jgi:hypothetical protein
VTFATADLMCAIDFLTGHGIPTTRTSDRGVHVDLAPAHGLNLFLTDRTIHGTPVGEVHIAARPRDDR